MNILKFFIFVILSFSFLISCATAQTERGKTADEVNKTPVKMESQQKIRERKPPEFETDTSNQTSLKILDEGSHSNVTTPFVFVARSAETFAQLQKIVKTPEIEKIDFNRTAVVAAFAGEKNTGGYPLDVEKSGDTISVKVAAPPKDAFVTQVLTTPFIIALVEIEQDNSLTLDLSSDFTKAIKTYRVTSGAFEVSGGITGMRKTFAAGGTIKILSFGNYATIIFDLTGKANEKRRTLNEVTSGEVKNGKVNLPRVEAGNFIDRPHPFLTAEGTVSASKLAFNFSPGKRDYVVRDGFTGGGKLIATKIK